MEELSPSTFLEKSVSAPVIDVRSPAEFAKGHIPGAYNLPLFENQERSVVGILYKNQGRQEAIKKGLEIVGPKLTSLVEKAIAMAKDQEILVHCWRGGMRSASVAWLFEASDLKVSILQGGYKNYRTHLRENMLEGRGVTILGGMTGSGKTNLLKALADFGEPVVDLEGIANHRGSAFGDVGLIGQPSTEQFENLLFQAMQSFPKGTSVWLEDESRRIGEIFIPEYFHQAMRNASVVVVTISDEERKKVLLDEYAGQADEELIEAIELLRKRLGGLVTQEAIEAIKRADFGSVVDLLLPYYDKMYNFGLDKRDTDSLIKADLRQKSDKERLVLLSDLRKLDEQKNYG